MEKGSEKTQIICVMLELFRSKKHGVTVLGMLSLLSEPLHLWGAIIVCFHVLAVSVIHDKLDPALAHLSGGDG